MRKLDQYRFSTKDGFNSFLLKIRYQKLKKFFKGNTCLEVGCADGEGTKILIKYFSKIYAVDGSKRLLAKARGEIKNPKVTFIHSMFETLDLNLKFDTIILGHVLEHVQNPILVLRHIKQYLSVDGIILIDVPNAESIHRLVGVEMGLIDNVHILNKADLSIGHRRVYDLALLKKDVQQAGLKIKKEGGLFLKFLSNSQITRLLEKKIINQNTVNALVILGEKYPNLAAEIYLVCQK